MKTTMRRTYGLCMVLCLGLTGGCVKVSVSVNAQGRAATEQTNPHWISLDDLKKLHSKKSCNTSSRDVIKERQQTPAWCWAASARMVMGYHNKSEPSSTPTDLQCDIVMNAFSSWIGGTDCCEEKVPPDSINAPPVCVQGYWPYEVFNKYNFTYKSVAGPLDWEALTGEICAAGPFITVIKWSGGGAHTFVVKGYDQEPQQTVEVYDPVLKDAQDMTFDEFVGDSPREEYEFHRFAHDRNIVQILPKDRP